MNKMKSVFENDFSTIKTLGDMAGYIKNLLPSEIPADYAIKPIFTSIEREVNIRNGILALKDFMNQLYDIIIEDGEKYDKPKPTFIPAGKKPSIPIDFPFIYHIKSVLLNIGYNSDLKDGVLTFSGLKTLTPIICCEGMPAMSKISAPKLLACLRFLNECGMYFEGLNLDAEKLNMASEVYIEVMYPDNPVLLTGLKIMSVAQRDLKWKTYDEIFLRCDYSALFV